jgi:outer membrane protein TolC
MHKHRLQASILLLVVGVAGVWAQQSASTNPVETPATSMADGALRLSLDEAIQRGLQHNLGILVAQQATRSARGARWRELSNLLPNVTGSVTESDNKENLLARGIHVPNAPKLVGPFQVFDARLSATQTVFDFSALQRVRAAGQNTAAADLSYDDARDLVVLAVGSAYLQAIAAESRVASAEAQVQTAQALFQKAADQHKAGVVPAIDELRAQVELQSRQQQRIVARNTLAKSKLALQRAIGMRVGGALELTDKIPYASFTGMTLDEALQKSLLNRSDYRAAAAQVRAAELSKSAAQGEHLPSLQANGDFGGIGPTPGQSLQTFHVAGTMKVPIFLGGKIKGDVLVADALTKQRQAELNDLRDRVEFEVRSAYLDLQATSEQVEVARSTVDLAQRTLAQSQDRFAAGVADNLEVVQAQEAVATAEDDYINSLYGFNFAKLSLARAVGISASDGQRMLQGK